MADNKEMARARYAGCKGTFKDPVFATMILCALSEKQNQQNPGEKQLHVITKIEFRAAKEHG